VRSFALAWVAVLALAAGSALPALPAIAQDELPAAPTDWVEDRADLLPPGEEAILSSRLERLERETGARVVVATYPALPPGAALENFTIRAVESWVVWREDDPAVAFFVFRDDRRMRLEVGYGAEAALTDLESKVILDEVVAPEFRRGDFAGGLAAGVDAIDTALRGDLEPRPRTAVSTGGRGSGDGSFWGFIFLLVFWFFIVPSLARRTGCTFVPMPFLGTGGVGGGGILGGGGRRGGWSGGGGGFSSGGGFSGGGGSFGGGGASGSW
jgi:uncharacterized protein